MQISIDLETMGVGTKPALLSLGAVKHTDTEILDQFHVGIDLGTCMAAGLEITASTVMWWLKSDGGAGQQAREALLGLETVDLGSALVGFAQWFGPEPLPTWGNGASSDNVWLRSAYEACGLECPFPFFMDRCYRTMKNLFPDVMAPVPRETHHDALDDARYQARHLMEIVKVMRGGAAPVVAPTVPQLLVDEGVRIIERDARQFRVYQENHERKSNDLSLQLGSREEAAGKANTNRMLAEESEDFLVRIRAAQAA